MVPSETRNKIIAVLEDIDYSKTAVLYELLRDETNMSLCGEMRLKQDIMASKDTCPMTKCWGNQNGKCSKNGINLIETCKKNNYESYEELNKGV